MEKDNFKTVVIFRKWKGEIIALFPYEIYNKGYTITSYMHVGQHGEADYDHIVNQSTLATEAEYADLKRELESLGYDLEVKRKRHYNTYLFWTRQSKIELNG